MTPPVKPERTPSAPEVMRMAARIRAANPNDVSHAELAQLTRTSFADTLRALAGRPSAYAVSANPSPDVLGEYAPHPQSGADTLFLTLQALNRDLHPTGQEPASYFPDRQQQPEYVLSHEMGHRAYERPDDSKIPATARGNQDVAYYMATGRPHLDGYWAQSPREHFAEAFANALAYLRTTARETPNLDLPTRLRDAAAQYEEAVPGTATMAQNLLATPIFANHPLNRSRAVPLAQPDMTATRPPGQPVRATSGSFADLLRSAMQSGRGK